MLKIKQLFSSQLRINMVSGVVTTVVNIVVLAIGYPVYLHFLGYETYGVWLILATVLTFAQLGDLGISSAVIKLVAEERGRGNIKEIQSYVTTSLVILLVTGSFALILILLFQDQIISAFKLSEQTAVIALRFLPYIAFLSVYVMLVQVLNSTISGLGRMDIANYILSVGRVVTVGVSTILLWFGNGIESLLIGTAVSYIFVGAVSIFIVKRSSNIDLFRVNNLSRHCFGRLLSFGGGVVGGSLVSMFLHPFNKLMISRYAGVSSIPVYEIAFKGSVQVRTLIEAGFRALMPEISRIGSNFSTGAHKGIERINRRAVRFVILGGLPVYAALFVLREPLLKFWLREKYVAELSPVFALMLCATFLSCIGVCSFYTVLGLGKVRHVFMAHTIKVAANIAVVMILVLLFKAVTPYSIAWAVIAAMGAASTYLLFTKRLVTNRMLALQKV